MFNKLNWLFFGIVFCTITSAQSVHIINVIDTPIEITTDPLDPSLKNPLISNFLDALKVSAKNVTLTIFEKKTEMKDLAENDLITVVYDTKTSVQNPTKRNEILILKSSQSKPKQVSLIARI